MYSRFFLRTSVVILITFICMAKMTESASHPQLNQHTPLRVTPQSQGFGTETPGGRGGKIIKVKTLADSGEGSLRSALEDKDPRIIVFEVGGIIPLAKNIYISRPFVTLAGQTSPSPGILIKGAGIIVETHDVLIQHIRIRCGDSPFGSTPSSRDALKILNSSYNVVIQNLSTSWATDENMSIWSSLKLPGAKNITISKSIISEGLNKSIHPEGQHSKGLLIGNNIKNISLIGNVFAHNLARNPLVYGNTSLVAANNLFYNSGSSSYFHISDGWHQGASTAAIVGNIFIDGPNTPAGASAIKIGKDAPGSKVFLSDNHYPGILFTNMSGVDALVPSPPIWTRPLDIIDSSHAEAHILLRAGARPADRDSVDKRIVDDVIKRSGRIIDSQNQVGGWPVLKSTFREFIVPSNPGGDDDGDGYTNIEELLQQMARELENYPSDARNFSANRLY